MFKICDDFHACISANIFKNHALLFEKQRYFVLKVFVAIEEVSIGILVKVRGKNLSKPERINQTMFDKIMWRAMCLFPGFTDRIPRRDFYERFPP